MERLFFKIQEIESKKIFLISQIDLRDLNIYLFAIPFFEKRFWRPQKFNLDFHIILVFEVFRPLDFCTNLTSKNALQISIRCGAKKYENIDFNKKNSE